MSDKLTERQFALWEELNFWHGMLAEAERGPRRLGLCGLAALDFGITSSHRWMVRARKMRPKRMWLNTRWWWEYGCWKPRIAFIKRVIAAIEADMERA